MTPAENKEFIRQHFEDFVNRKDLSAADRDGDRRMMAGMHAAMPDLHLTIEDMIAEGDKVMCRNVWRWTDTASGTKMEFHGFVLWRLADGKIAERWACVTPPAPRGI